MRLKTFAREHAVALVVAFDLIAVTVFWYLLPGFKRPFEGLMVMLAVLGILTTAAARKRKWLSAVAMSVASVAFAVFTLETAERWFKITGLLDKEQTMQLGAPPYAWDPFQPASYIVAKDRARRDGVEPEALAEHFGGDVFTRLGIANVRSRSHYRGNRPIITETVGDESPWLRNSPIGSEIRPNTMFRQYCFDRESGKMMFDGVYTIGPYGFRNTRCNDDAEDVYVFRGGSFTFGDFLNDDQTLPYYFSELYGFDKRVVNLSKGGDGPHHCLRDMELNHRLGRAGVKAEQVRAVVYTYIDDHAKRVVHATSIDSPRYVVEDGRAVFKGTFADTGEISRFRMMMNRSRIYPALRDRFLSKSGGADYDLLYAIVGEMNRISQERYGVPLVVVSWSTVPETRQRFLDLGVTLIPVSEAFGDDWRDMAIKFMLFDGHPSAYGNKLLARRVQEVLETN